MIHGDADSTYYYNAKLFSDGKPINSIFHPGIAANYVGASVLKYFGSEIEKTQEQLNQIYLCLSLINSAVLLFFTIYTVRIFGSSIAVFVVCVVVSWPSFLPYMNSFSPDSLTFVFSLPIAMLLWRILHEKEPKITVKFLLGFVVGTALANKFNFIPIAGAVFLASWLSSFLNTRKYTTAFLDLIMTLAGAAAGFIILMAPILTRMPDVIIGTFIGRPTSQVSLDASNALTQLFHVSPVLFAILISLFFVFFISIIFDIRNISENASKKLIIIALFVCFYFSMATTVLDHLESAFRNVAPAAIVLPLAAFYIFDRYRAVVQYPIFRCALLFVGVLCVSTTVALHIDRRALTIAHVTASKQLVDNFVRENFSPESIKIIWDGSSGDGSWGEAAFHHWSNYAYGAEKYDRAILGEYPRFSWLRLRHLRDGALGGSKKDRRIPKSLMQRTVSALSETWHSVFPRPYERKDFDRIFVGEGRLHGRAHILMPVSEFENEMQTRGISLTKFFEFVRARYPDASLRTISINGVNWIVIDLTIPNRTQSGNAEPISWRS